MTAFATLMRAMHEDGVQFVVIGVWGANLYAGTALFVTKDQDLFLPPEPDNLLGAWRCCERVGLELFANDEPLDQPRDDLLAAAVVRTRALTYATDHGALHVDLSLVMGNFEFADVCARRRMLVADGVQTPVASLVDIVEAKRIANRLKDRLFLATHAAELRRLLGG